MATYNEPTRRYPGTFYSPSLNADQPAGEINTACTICKFLYYDESGCDPCPKCGASYGSQIWHEEDAR